MGVYLARRLITACGTIWLVSLAVFILLRVSPGDSALLQQGLTATPERMAAVRHELGLDRPLPEQYLRWLDRAIQGDLGKSSLTQVSVTYEVSARFPVSLQLMLMTMGWVCLLGIGSGCLAARWRSSGFDHGVRFVAGLGLSLPAFWLATLVLMLPAQLWHYAPPLGEHISLFAQPFRNLSIFLPASLVLALGPTALVFRLTRAGVLGVLNEDYIRTARAKGLEERVILFRHALRNALIPVVTVLGLLSIELLAGSVVIETIFALRGLGAYIFEALLQKDYPVAQTMVLYTATVAVLLNLTVDIIYGAIDPRVRSS